MVIVRPRTDADFAALEVVAARVRAVDDYPAYLPGDDYRRFLTRPLPTAAWVAEHNARVCGHVALSDRTSPAIMDLLQQVGITQPDGVVTRLLVDPDVRRRGVASTLLQTARAEASARQSTPVLDVVDSQLGAVALYRASGWVEVGTATLQLPAGSILHELVFTAT